MIKDVKNIEFIDKNGVKILIINFVIMFILFIIPFLPLKLMSLLNEPMAVVLAFSVFILSKLNFLFLIASILATITVMAHSLIPNKTIKNYLIILSSTVLIIIYLTMFNLLIIHG